MARPCTSACGSAILPAMPSKPVAEAATRPGCVRTMTTCESTGVMASASRRSRNTRNHVALGGAPRPPMARALRPDDRAERSVRCRAPADTPREDREPGPIRRASARLGWHRAQRIDRGRRASPAPPSPAMRTRRAPARLPRRESPASATASARRLTPGRSRRRARRRDPGGALRGRS